MFRQFVDYLCHWLLSHSRHGTHSPFVYQLVDEVVYNDRALVPERVAGIRPAKVNALINRIIDFWLKDETDKREYVLIESDAAYLKEFNECLPKVHPHYLMIFLGIYRTRKNKADWHEMIQHPRVTVAVDLYYIGLVFFRKGQAKENFKIRF